jgi:predicted transcriptional regulator of viral defense system
MQPMKRLSQWLSQNANDQRYLFTSHDLRAFCCEHADSAFKTLLSRAVRSGLLVRVCRGVYFYKGACSADGLLLFHVAALLRADKFNYISLETVLSDAGVISQVPMQWISVMSSGRSSTITCGEFGTIEFVHTNQTPVSVMDQLIYDHHCGMWRASVALALRDMKAARRNLDLINWDIVNELI